MEKLFSFKAILRIAGIIALTAVIGFSMIACPDDGGNENKETPPPPVNSITVTAYPAQMEYAIGEAFAPAGLLVTAAYADDTTAVVTSYTTSGFDSAEAGDKIITVSYGGKTATFTVIVNPAGKTLSGITVTELPAKTSYNTNETFNRTGMVITANYSDETTRDVTAYAAITGFDSTTIGNKVITVTYNKKNITFTVLISSANKSLSSITVTTTKTAYAIGETLDNASIVVTAAYSDSSTGAVTDYAVTGFDSTASGSKTITISYGGKTAVFTVMVNPEGKTLSSIAISAQPTKTAYEIGETFAAAGLVVTAAYNDSSTEAVTGYAIIGFDSSTGGSKTVTVSYGGKTASLSVMVNFAVTFNTVTANGNATTTTTQLTLTFSGAITGLSAADITLTGIDNVVKGTLSGGYNGIYYLPISGFTSSGTLNVVVEKNGYTVEPPLKTVAINFYSIVPLNAPELTFNTWSDGNITTAGGTQWFKFTATTATSQYINFMWRTLSSVYVQLYNDAGATVGTQSYLNSYTLYLNITSLVTAGNVYYIKITPYTNTNMGTYKIGFSASTAVNLNITPPIANITQLTANTWANGNIAAAGGEQWFKFTATADTQYIHLNPSQSALNNIYVQLYAINGTSSGSRATLSSSSSYSQRTSLANGNDYYIMVTASSPTDNGSYKIAVNISLTAPAITETIPNSGVTQLTADTWTDGNITTTNKEQWFKFTATATTQYIHFSEGTLDSVWVQVYDNSGSGSQTWLRDYGTTARASFSLTSGYEYHIKVIPYSSSYDGAYKITFNASTTAPNMPISLSSVTTLTANSFSNGNITTAGGEQWFKFTATATTHYIHFSPSTLESVYVYIYTNNGATNLNQTNWTRNSSISRTTLTSGETYYIKVTPNSSSGSGNFKIGFNSSVLPPGVTAATLTANTWGEGNIIKNSEEQWFSFTATASTHYIHFSTAGTLRDVWVRVYDAGTNAEVGSETNLYSSRTNTSRSVTSGNIYYIRVYPWGTINSGTFKIGFTTSTTAPAQ